MTQNAFLRTLSGEKVDPSPIWLMRQAGRYLPEYRETRAEAGGFLDLCFSPEFATEVTLQPIRRFGFDAAILFSDILVTPLALGQKVWFEEGEGPRLDPAADKAAIDKLSLDGFSERLEAVFEAIRRIKAALPAGTPLIGFAGAPWTLATYMIAGRGSTDHAAAKLFALEEPELFQKMLDITTEAVGVCSAKRKLPRSARTMWTRAPLTPRRVWMERAISPSSARTRVTSCMKAVRPSEPRLSNSS